MRKFVHRSFLLAFVLAAATLAVTQSDYKVIPVTNGGTISGTVKMVGPVPHQVQFPVTKDPQICDPDSKKTVDLERLLIGQMCIRDRHIAWLGKAGYLPH